MLNSLYWDSDRDISISVSSLILNDDPCKSEARADGGICQTNLCSLSSHCGLNIFKFCHIQRGLGN